MTPRPESMLSNNQRRAVVDIFAQRWCLLTSDCGFGKTITALTLVRDALLKSDRPTLIVGNKKAVDGAWSNEHKEWAHTQHLRVQVLTGTPAQRVNKLAEPADIYVCTYGVLKWLSKQEDKNFVIGVADEASCLKGATAATRKYLELVTHNTAIRLAMTATPKTRNEDDYWGICRWVDRGAALGATISEFRNQYMTGVDLPNRGKLWKMKNLDSGDQVREKIKHLFIEYPLEKGADVPFKEYKIECRLSPTSQVTYDHMAEKGLVAGTTFKDGEPLSTLQIKNYLAQLSSGFLYEETEQRIELADMENATSALALLNSTSTRTPRDLFSDRVDAGLALYQNIIDTHGEVPLLVCYQYKHELTQLYRMFPYAIDDTMDGFEGLFNSGLYPIGLLQYQRSSKSVNLQFECWLMMLYSQTFSFEDNYQIKRRIARQGQKKPECIIYTLHFVDTVDDIKADRALSRHLTHEKMRKLILK